MLTKKIQKQLYLRLIDLLYKAHASHIGSCLSCFDTLMQTLIFEMNKEDKFILSKGHAAPALYVVLNYLKKITDKELMTFHQEGTKLPAHPPSNFFKDVIPFPTGSLGHGLSLSCGIAEAIKFKAKSPKNIAKVFCLMSDGECNEGQVWEAAQYASHRKLSNLIVLIDKNGIQACGKTTEILGDSASSEKWQAFGFDTYEVNGHHIAEINKIYKKIKEKKSPLPKVVILKTIKGYGISFMENTVDWHYNYLNEETYQKAIAEIKVKYED